MATIVGSVGRIIHDTSAALIDNQIPTKLSDLVTGFVKSGFDITEDVLKIVRDLSEPQETPDEPGEGGGS